MIYQALYPPSNIKKAKTSYWNYNRFNKNDKCLYIDKMKIIKNLIKGE